MMNSSFQLAFYDTPDSLSLQEMVECDSREMDFNLNDPLFQLHEQGIFQDIHQQMMAVKKPFNLITRLLQLARVLLHCRLCPMTTRV